MSGSYFALNSKYQSLLALIDSIINGGGGGVPTSSTLAQVLLNGNSAGVSDIDVSNNNILNCNDLQTITINGNPIPSGSPNTLAQVLTAGNTATNNIILDNSGTGVNLISLLPNFSVNNPHIELTDGTTTNRMNKNGYTTRNTNANSTHFLNFVDASGTAIQSIQQTTGLTCNPSKSQLFASNYLVNAETLNASGTISVETRDTIITASGDYILPDGLYTGQTKNIFANTTSPLNDYKPLSTTNSLTGRAVASVNKVLKIGTDIYIGGSFTGDQTGNQNATNALKIFVKYDTLTDTYSNLTGAVINTGSVLDMVYDGVNTIYLCGNFTNVSGLANTAFIARYNIATNTTTALSASVPNNNVSAMTLVGTNLYFVGAFTQVGGVDATKSFYCRYDTTTGIYTGNATAGVSLINAQGTCIYYDPTSTKLFIGGGFTNTNRLFICYANLTTGQPASTGNIFGLSALSTPSFPLNAIVGLAGSGNTGITADGSGNLYFAGGFSFVITPTANSANGIVRYNIAGDTYSPVNIEGNFFGINSSCEFIYYQSSANVLWFAGSFTGVGMYNPNFVTYSLNSNLPYYNNGITYFAGVNLTTNKLVWTSGKGFQQGVRSIIEYPAGTGKLLIGGSQNTAGSSAPDPLLQTLTIFDPATSGRIKITSNNSSFREPGTYSYTLNNNAKYIAITQSKSYTGLIWNGSYWITINDVKAGGITFTTNWLAGA
jgi:hypothetical protein